MQDKTTRRKVFICLEMSKKFHYWTGNASAIDRWAVLQFVLKKILNSSLRFPTFIFFIFSPNSSHIQPLLFLSNFIPLFLHCFPLLFSPSIPSQLRSFEILPLSLNLKSIASHLLLLWHLNSPGPINKINKLQMLQVGRKCKSPAMETYVLFYRRTSMHYG